MHPAVQDFVTQALTAEHVAGKRVLEVGSYDVNGSVRPYIESLDPAEYLGVDAGPGPSVDRVVDCEQLCSQVGNDWDIVISTEMLEHVKDWQTCMAQLAEAVTPNGHLIVTTRSPGFPYHPFPDDFWRFTIEQMTQILTTLGFVSLTVADDPQCPGVFGGGRKPLDWQPSSLDSITVERVEFV